jgi:hypothetical protein
VSDLPPETPNATHSLTFPIAVCAKGVDAMLARVYEPLLFRALAAANPAVRTPLAIPVGLMGPW